MIELPKLDPWVASSLLQKAVRRGETEIAVSAAAELLRHRGKGVWRRLVGIALEDVGIAAPSLVAETIRLARDEQLRTVLGSDAELITELTDKLAAAPKDRSADYLFCSSTRLPSAKAAERAMSRQHPDSWLELAADVDRPLVDRAVAALLACSVASAKLGSRSALALFFEKFEGVIPSDLHDALILEASEGGHLFTLMIPLLQSALDEGTTVTARCRIPANGTFNGLPLYAFDKHTAVGKKAISTFARGHPAMTSALRPIAIAHRASVALMAAFYAEAMPVLSRLEWTHSQRLERLGLQADMHFAGCPPEFTGSVVDAVRTNLPDLDGYRLALLRAST